MPDTRYSSLGNINKEGGLMIYNRHLQVAWQEQHKGKTIRIDISVIEDKTSSKSNAFYWVSIVPAFIRGFRETGLDLDKVQAHREIRKLCPHMRLYNDEGKLYLRSLDDEDWIKHDWQEFIRQAIQLLSEHFNIVINDPK